MMHGLIDACARRLRNEGALRSWTQEPTTTNAAQVGPYDSAILPRGIRSRFIDSGNGLRTHVLEAGFGANGRPCVVLLPISPD
jgi:hypothetical protein